MRCCLPTKHGSLGGLNGIALALSNHRQALGLPDAHFGHLGGSGYGHSGGLGTHGHGHSHGGHNTGYGHSNKGGHKKGGGILSLIVGK